MPPNRRSSARLWLRQPFALRSRTPWRRSRRPPICTPRQPTGGARPQRWRCAPSWMRMRTRRDGAPMRTELTVNGTVHAVDVEPRTTLLDCLRDHLGLTGAHAGCEHGVCGACTVLLDGAAVRSCLIFAVQADGFAIT